MKLSWLIHKSLTSGFLKTPDIRSPFLNHFTWGTILSTTFCDQPIFGWRVCVHGFGPKRLASIFCVLKHRSTHVQKCAIQPFRSLLWLKRVSVHNLLSSFFGNTPKFISHLLSLPHPTWPSWPFIYSHTKLFSSLYRRDSQAVWSFVFLHVLCCFCVVRIES